ncbi:hypothetical protein D3C87_1225360 [compost metagenome]
MSELGCPGAGKKIECRLYVRISGTACHGNDSAGQAGREWLNFGIDAQVDLVTDLTAVARRDGDDAGCGRGGHDHVEIGIDRGGKLCRESRYGIAGQRCHAHLPAADLEAQDNGAGGRAGEGKGAGCLHRSAGVGGGDDEERRVAVRLLEIGNLFRADRPTAEECDSLVGAGDLLDHAGRKRTGGKLLANDEGLFRPRQNADVAIVRPDFKQRRRFEAIDGDFVEIHYLSPSGFLAGSRGFSIRSPSAMRRRVKCVSGSGKPSFGHSEPSGR